MKIVFIAACIAATSALVCKRCVDSDNSEFDAVIEGYSEFDKDIDVKKCSIQLILLYQYGIGGQILRIKCFRFRH